ALVTVQQLDDLLAHTVQVGAELHQNLGGDALALTDQSQQDVLGADVVVAELPRLTQSQLEHLLGTRSERDVTRRRLLTLADDLLDLLAHRCEPAPQALQSPGTNALTLVDETKEDVLGADVVVVEHPGLFLGQDDNAPRAVGEPLEHLVAPHRAVGQSPERPELSFRMLARPEEATRCTPTRRRSPAKRCSVSSNYRSGASCSRYASSERGFTQVVRRMGSEGRMGAKFPARDPSPRDAAREPSIRFAESERRTGGPGGTPACRDAVRGERYAFACATRESPRGASGQDAGAAQRNGLGAIWETSGRRTAGQAGLLGGGRSSTNPSGGSERADARGRLIVRIDQSGPGEPTARPMNETGRSGVNQVSWPPRTARSRGRGSGRAH